MEMAFPFMEGTPASPQSEMLEPPRLKVEEKMESTCDRERAWMGLFLLTKKATASSATLISVGL